ncbi:hypothetical protein PHYPSEUDO_004960 [Phytophthora pseudosyringae]|uniref:FYVE-type domain-containing protein n=1 Tax=Phytophthora pseudosyringae TaxID=221518 RepID=A0A8T1WDX9_9STRA|nr:hypothetical protein PHYPSEUDO_004960 [Phytophthora pseudosyringae]
MSRVRDGWSTSPTAASDVRWGVSSSAKLLSRPSRQAATQSATDFELTLQPFDETISPFGQTVGPFERTKRPTQPTTEKPSRPAQQPSRQPQTPSRRQTQEPSRPSQQRPSQRIPEHETTFGRSMGPSRQRPSSAQDPRQPRRQSEQPSDQRVRTFERSLRPSRPVVNDAEPAQPPRRQSRQLPDERANSFERSMRQSKPGPNHRRSSSSAQQPPRPSQKISMGFPHLERHRSDKSASSGSASSSSESIVELSPARRREIISRVSESVQSVMASMLSDSSSSVQWKPKLRKKDISYYLDESSVKPGQTRFCCVSHSHATVDEIMKLFVVPDADAVVRNNRVLSDSLLEARVLSVLRRPTRERPMNSMYVRYSSYQTPGLMANRDLCLAVATDIIRQPDGSTIGYCLWDSIDDPEFANANSKSGLEPCTMFRSGYFLRRSSRRSSSSGTEQNYTKIVYMVGLEPGGWAPGLTARLLMEKFGDNLTRLCSHFRRKKLDSRTFVMKTQWASKMSAKRCKECAKPFQVLSNRVNCHACGHVVCRPCASKELVELHAVGLVPMHVCFTCLEKAGLPVPASSQKAHSSQRRRRLQSDTTAISRVTAHAQAEAHPLSQSQPLQQSKSVVDSDLIEEEDDDDDTDTGEWAFTPAGVPVRPYRMK